MRRLFFLIAVFAVCASMFASTVHSEKITFNLDVEFSGGIEPAGPKPWLTASFEDIFANPGDLQPSAVGLTMTAGGLGSGAYVGGWYFNIDPIYTATLGFLYQSSSGPKPSSFIQQSNSINAYGDQGAGFDLLFSFPAPTADTFEDGESVFILIAGNNANSSIFNFLNQPPNGQGNFFSAAQVLGIGGEGFAWIAAAQDKGPGPGPDPIPEPATLLLIGAGLSGLGFFSRSKLLKK